MENLRNIAEELRTQIQEAWTLGSPRTNREAYTRLLSYTPNEIAGIYVASYAEEICNQSKLFWCSIDMRITSLIGYYKDAESYLNNDFQRPATTHVAKCLLYTSLAYIMVLIYYGLLMESITSNHIQQINYIDSVRKGLGLQIAGIDIQKYNQLLQSTNKTHTSTQSVAETDKEATPTQSPSEKRKLSVVTEMSGVYQSVVDSMLGSLKNNRLISDDAASQPIFNGPCDLYAYMVWKIAERVNIQRISWDAILSILPPKERTDKTALKNKVSDYRKQKVKNMPRGANLIDAAIKLYITR